MYRYGDRNQMTFLPPSIEDYVVKNHPVRAYDAFVEALDLKDLGIALDENKVGNSSYHPKLMLKLLVYGYSYGTRSSRKLEREVINNLSFIWLAGGLTPDHKTIAEFRRNNKEPIKKVLKQCAMLCIKFGLIDGNALFVDSTRIHASANLNNNWTKKRCQKLLEHVDTRINDILDECERTDCAESGQTSYALMQEDITNAQALKEKVKTILNTLEQENKKQLNTTDPDCRAMGSSKGTRPAYNNQIVVDEKHGLIVSAETTNDVTDINQLARQIEQANEVLPQPCTIACADAGYNNTDECEKVALQNITPVVSPRPDRETKKDLVYDKEHDRFLCAQGKQLLPIGLTNDKKSMMYRIEHTCDCQKCKKCTTSKTGRTTSRLFKEDFRQQCIEQYRSPEGKAIHSLRKQKVELPFGHIKRNLRFDSFLLRGLAGAGAEFALGATCFNIARMITLFGVMGLTTKLAG